MIDLKKFEQNFQDKLSQYDSSDFEKWLKSRDNSKR